MKFKALCNTIVKFASKNSPYILSGVGASAITVGTVLVVKKAKKSNETVDKKVLDRIECARQDAADEKEKRKLVTKAYMRSAWDYTRYYAAPVLLIGGGMSCMFSATLIQTKRLKAMSAAYTALAAAFNEYRDRVKLAVGEDKEKDIFEGVKRDDKGNIISTDPIDKKYLENTQMFSRLFGDGNSVYWSKKTSLCVQTLKAAEGNLNQLLRFQGFVTLNDVWQELGMRKSEEGMYLGWRWKYGDPVYGDTYIDLGFCGPKNNDKCEELRHDWNTEIWINLVPPHTLFGKLPKEVIRTEDQKAAISRRRRQLQTPTEVTDYE